MIRCILACFLCFSQLALAQDIAAKRKYDSLVRAIKRSPSDTNSIELYHALAAEIAEREPLQALTYEDSALVIAKRIKSTKHVAVTLTRLASYHQKLSEYQKAYQLLLHALEISPSTSPWLGETYLESGITLLRMSLLDSAMTYVNKGLEHLKKYPDAYLEGSFYNMIGNVRREQNNYEAALDNYIKAVKIFDEQKNLKGLTQALSNVGNIHNLLGNTDKALDYAQQSLAAAKAANFKRAIAYSHRLIGRIYRKQGKKEEALEAYNNASNLYRDLRARRDLGETQVSIGNIYFDQGKYRQAIHEYGVSIGTLKSIPDTLNMAFSYLATGNAYMQLKDFKNAKDYLDTTIRLAVMKQIPTLRMDAYGILSDIFEAEGNYKISKNYYVKYIKLRDSVTLVQDRKAAQEIEARYQGEKKDNEIRILNAENELKATQIRSKNNERNYLLLSLGLAVVLAGFIYNRYKVKLKANEKLKELDQIKSRFFTNVSHEFRTPLSLIIGPLEEKLARSQQDSDRDNLLLMLRNARRLQNLINQLLDLSRLEAGNMELHLQEGEISSFIRLVGSTFSSLADRKGLVYQQDIFDTSYTGCFDRDKLEKMLNNLLSNAFKFTAEGGIVNMKAVIKEGKLVVEVKDSGIGIPEEKIDHIFNRFYQIDDSITRSSEGSGIGLALTKELADLHRGKLTVSSREGIGSVFTLMLPVSRESFRDLPVSPAGEEKEPIPALSSNLEVTTMDDDDSKPLILFAEDNLDMQKFVGDLLKERYRILTVGNGKEAFEKAKTLVPDLVITDWMMPIMDGRTCCEKLKTTDATSHIPVLMLTARADQSSKLEGLETGADDYLIKPFNTSELTVRVNNLIQQRNKLRDIFSKEITLQPKNVSLPSRDATFLSNFLSLVEKHYADPAFSVETLSDAVNMSRMQLHRKLKALTDQSPGEFLRKFRLERAKQFLSVDGTQVSEVCFKVGFNNVSHFSKAFRDFTGVTPTEFIDSAMVKK